MLSTKICFEKANLFNLINFYITKIKFLGHNEEVYLN